MISSQKQHELIHQARENFIQGAGGIAGSLLGILNRVCGQIFALLFLSPEPLSLDNIVQELGVSKGSVSINIRLLEDFHLVKKVWVKGSRRDYYAAVPALPREVIRIFFDKIRRTIEDSLDMIRDSHDLIGQAQRIKPGTGQDGTGFMLDRLCMVKGFYEAAHHLFEAIYSGANVDTRILGPILNGVKPSKKD